MFRVRRLLTLVCVFSLVLVAFMLPASASAAADVGRDLEYADDGEPGGSLLLAVPGVFSLLFGPGQMSESGAITLGPAQLSIPAANAVATVDGLTFGPGTFGFDTVTIAQALPTAGNGLMINDAQATISGPATGYSTEASARLAVGGGQAVQAEGTVKLRYDALTGAAGLALADAGLAVDTDAVQVGVSGLNSSAEGFAVDVAQVTLPAAGAVLTFNGFSVGPEGANWDALTLSPADVSLGDVATISDLQISIYGPSSGKGAEASATVALHPGPAMYVGGEVKTSYDPSRGQVTTSFCDGTVQFETGGVVINVNGICYDMFGFSVDEASVAMPTLGVEAGVTGVSAGMGEATSFDSAGLRYVPVRPGPISGFEILVQQSDQGKLLTTSTLFPTQ